jgi:hypothetical protein
VQTVFEAVFNLEPEYFPGDNAHGPYQSVPSLMRLSGDTRLYMCHDYMPTLAPT